MLGALSVRSLDDRSVGISTWLDRIVCMSDVSISFGFVESTLLFVPFSLCVSSHNRIQFDLPYEPYLRNTRACLKNKQLEYTLQ